MECKETSTDKAAGHDAEAPETVAAVHDRRHAALFDHICLDIEPKFNRREADPEKHEQEEQRGKTGRSHRQRHEHQKHRKPEDQRIATAYPTDQLPGKGQHQQDAGWQSEQCHGKFGRTERQPLLNAGDLRQPATERDWLQEKGSHDGEFGGHQRTGESWQGITWIPTVGEGHRFGKKTTASTGLLAYEKEERLSRLNRSSLPQTRKSQRTRLLGLLHASSSSSGSPMSRRSWGDR